MLSDKPDKEYVFRISEDEAKVVASTSNTLLLGRSGTGKTTCAVLRMWSAEREYRKAAAAADGPLLLDARGRQATASDLHQCFVTVSHNLCHHVRKNLHSLDRTLCEKEYVWYHLTYSFNIVLHFLTQKQLESVRVVSLQRPLRNVCSQQRQLSSRHSFYTLSLSPRLAPPAR